jgi:hypothetical protein
MALYIYFIKAIYMLQICLKPVLKPLLRLKLIALFSGKNAALYARVALNGAGLAAQPSLPND